VPAGDDQAADAFDQVRDRVGGRDVAKPGRRDQVPGDVHRREEEKDEEGREEALNGLPRAGPKRRERPERAEAERDEEGEAEENEHTERPGRGPNADGEADAQIDGGL